MANVTGTDEEDNLIGTLEPDRLLGMDGDDMLDSGPGDDVLVGNQGDDELLGGDDADEFAFTEEDGDDVILDFTPGEDLIVLLNGIPEDIGMILSEVEEDPIAEGALLTYGETDISLAGIPPEAVSGDWFMLVPPG